VSEQNKKEMEMKEKRINLFVLNSRELIIEIERFYFYPYPFIHSHKKRKQCEYVYEKKSDLNYFHFPVVYPQLKNITGG
jgi:hypothetical protein